MTEAKPLFSIVSIFKNDLKDAVMFTVHYRQGDVWKKKTVDHKGIIVSKNGLVSLRNEIYGVEFVNPAYISSIEASYTEE